MKTDYTSKINSAIRKNEDYYHITITDDDDDISSLYPVSFMHVDKDSITFLLQDKSEWHDKGESTDYYLYKLGQRLDMSVHLKFAYAGNHSGNEFYLHSAWVEGDSVFIKAHVKP